MPTFPHDALAARLAAADGVQTRVDDALDARLCSGDPAPLAVALSGGGDSLALLLIVRLWADRRGRPLLALTVDHRLRPEGAAWAGFCAARCRGLGVAHRTLVWSGEKPTTGLAAAARRARHRLLAEAARAAGARVLLMGHTADDRAEADLMRAAGSTVTAPRAWAPSPVWPEGRGLFILRPLLSATRDEPRDWLAARGETWIEDPANSDPASLRARVRAARRQEPSPVGRAAPPPRDEAPSGVTMAEFREGPAGDLRFGDPGPATRITREDLAAALVCASGGERRPRGDSLARLSDRLDQVAPFTATLVGARVDSDGAGLTLCRDTGVRAGAPPNEAIALPRGRPVVWDGRFEARADIDGVRLGHLAGRAARLGADLRAAMLASTPAAARPSLPLAELPSGELALPTVRKTPGIAIRSLVLERMTAARGGIVSEEALQRMAKAACPS